MRTVFWGTPQAAVPFLERLCALEDVVGVVTRPDKPSQRGQQVHASPVKALALQKNFPLLPVLCSYSSSEYHFPFNFCLFT
jgi:methionyl-tRNA formyltransferase